MYNGAPVTRSGLTITWGQTFEFYTEATADDLLKLDEVSSCVSKRIPVMSEEPPLEDAEGDEPYAHTIGKYFNQQWEPWGSIEDRYTKTFQLVTPSLLLDPQPCHNASSKYGQDLATSWFWAKDDANIQATLGSKFRTDS